MFLTSELLQKKIESIVTIKRSNGLLIDCVIKNYDNKDINIKPIIVERLIIKRYFYNIDPTYNHFTDNVELYLQLQVLDMIKLYKNSKSLYIELMISFADLETGREDLERGLIRKTYRVYLKDAEDILKKYNLKQFKDVDDLNNKDKIKLEEHNTIIPVVLQLIEPEMYEIRKKSLNGIFTNITIDQFIKYILKCMDISKINMVMPDNNTQYLHLYIDPEYSKFDIIFDYIQKRYGVYFNGFNYYFTNGIMYIYPPYDTNPSFRKEILHIYRTAPRSYVGMQNYYKKENDNLYIVSNSDVNITKLSELGYENEGTHELFLRSDNIINHRTQSGEKFFLNKNTICVANKKDSIKNNTIVPSYKKPTINAYYRASSLTKKRAELVLLSWSYAMPFYLIPGHKVKIYYDDNTKIKIQNGILESVIYTFDRQVEVKNNQDIFLSNANLVIRCEL
jgi:hypothetical protein